MDEDQGTIRLPLGQAGQQDPNNALAGMTPEELAYLRTQLDQVAPVQNEPQRFTYTLPNGQHVEGTQEEVQRALDEHLAQTGQPNATQQNGQQANQLPQWQQNQFDEYLRKNDQKGALDYYMQTTFGGDPRELISTLATALGNVGTQVLDYSQQQFKAAHENYPDGAYNEALSFCSDNGWPVNSQNLNRAAVLLEHEGRIKPQPEAGPQGVPQAMQPAGSVPAPSAGSQYGQQFNQGRGLPDATQQNFVPAHLDSAADSQGWADVPNDVNSLMNATSHMETEQLRNQIDQILQGQGRVQ